MIIAIYRDIYDTIVLYIVILYLCANDMHENGGRIIRIQFISKTKRGDSLAKKLGIPFFRKKTKKRKGLPSFPLLLLVSTLINHFSFFHSTEQVFQVLSSKTRNVKNPHYTSFLFLCESPCFFF